MVEYGLKNDVYFSGEYRALVNVDEVQFVGKYFGAHTRHGFSSGCGAHAVNLTNAVGGERRVAFR